MNTTVTQKNSLWQEAQQVADNSRDELIRRVMQRLRQPNTNAINCPLHAFHDNTCKLCDLIQWRNRCRRDIDQAQACVHQAIGTNSLDNVYYAFQQCYLALHGVESRLNQEMLAIEHDINKPWDERIEVSRHRIRLSKTRRHMSDQRSIMAYRFGASHYRTQHSKGEHRHG